MMKYGENARGMKQGEKNAVCIWSLLVFHATLSDRVLLLDVVSKGEVVS